jgi:hypothetical protein
MLFCADGNWQYRDLVHVPSQLHHLFDKGEVVGLHLETLGTNSVSSRLLDESPSFAVLGVELADGRRVCAVPPVFGRARMTRLLGAAGFMAVGIAIALTPAAWVGGLVVGLATHLVRTALAIRVAPFWPPARSGAHLS